MSNSENKILHFLKENNISFISQKKFDGCRFKKSLFFDFYLPEYNLCIEYQGQQHYFPVEYFSSEGKTSEEIYNENIDRDKIKKDFCKNNGIFLLEIPYFEKNNFKEIIFKKMSEIMIIQKGGII
jgi:ABC-type microcin C transport system permease subunit YejE